MLTLVRLLCLCACATLLCSPARAQRRKGAAPPPPAVEPERPWAIGVAPEVQARALALYKEGNALFEESQHAQAVEKYRGALALWDHPAIHYNLAVSLINLGQPLQAYEHLLPSLRFGQAPLGPEMYKQALTYQKLLLGQLAHLKVTCNEADALVTLDGQQLFKAPGEAERTLLPGSHQLVVTKPGHLTESRPLLLAAGAEQDEAIQLVPIKSALLKRRWAWWKPVLVGAAGIVVASAIGVPLLLRAKADYASYDSKFSMMYPNGTPASSVPSSMNSIKSRAAIENGVAIGGFVVGGALIAAGAVMLGLNTPRYYEKHRTPPKVAFIPSIGARSAAAAVELGF